MRVLNIQIPLWCVQQNNVVLFEEAIHQVMSACSFVLGRLDEKSLTGQGSADVVAVVAFMNNPG